MVISRFLNFKWFNLSRGLYTFNNYLSKAATVVFAAPNALKIYLCTDATIFGKSFILEIYLINLYLDLVHYTDCTVRPVRVHVHPVIGDITAIFVLSWWNSDVIHKLYWAYANWISWWWIVVFVKCQCYSQKKMKNATDKGISYRE